MFDATDATLQPQGDHPSPRHVDYRPIHYLGSKLRYLDQIREAVDLVSPGGGAICDLFSGSGTVSLAFATSRRVVAADIQEYSRVLCEAVLTPHTNDLAAPELHRTPHYRALMDAAAPLLAVEHRASESAQRGNLTLLRSVIEDSTPVGAENGFWIADPTVRSAVTRTLDNLRAAGLHGVSSVAIRHFGGAYFSYAQAVELDALADWTRRFGSPQHRAALLGAASDAVNTVGKQFAQPLRLTAKDGSLKRHLLPKVARERAASVSDLFRNHLAAYAALPQPISPGNRALRGDFAQIIPSLKGSVGVVYADPPYTRDHYSRFYHVLETLALGDDPKLDRSNIGDGISRGFYRASRHQSDFCIKSKAPAAFGRLFEGVASLGVPLVLSYSGFNADKGGRPRLLAIDDIVAQAGSCFRKVNVSHVSGSSHSKLTSVDLNKGASTSHEVLILCEGPVRA